MEEKITGFTFEELITKEEKAICNGVANGMKFDNKSVNGQLAKARKLSK